jgi:hypothetical protein
METNLHLYVSENPKSAYDSENNLQDENVADIPIITQLSKKLPISNKLDVLVPPQTLMSALCTLTDTVDL